MPVVNDLGAYDEPYRRRPRMKQAHMMVIERAIKGLKLPPNFKWHTPGMGFTCKAEDVGLGSFVKCLENENGACPFSMPYADSNYCKCFARIYMARELKM
jgi:hypothetical protein